MGKIKLELTVQECEVIMKGLMELPGKVMLKTMQGFDAQVREQLPKEEEQKDGA